MVNTENNSLGLNKYQIAVIENNYKVIKPLLAKRDKALAKKQEAIHKIEEKYKSEMQDISEQIEVVDRIAKDFTLVSIGEELDTATCIERLNAPAAIVPCEETTEAETVEELSTSDELQNY